MSFLCEKNRNIVRELIDLLVENGQEVPSFMENMCQYSSSNRRPQGGQGKDYGGRDFRKSGSGGGGEQRQTSYSQQGPARGGGGYGGSSGGGGNDNSAW